MLFIILLFFGIKNIALCDEPSFTKRTTDLQKSSENHDFYVAKGFFDFHVFLLYDDSINNKFDRHRPL